MRWPDGRLLPKCLVIARTLAAGLGLAFLSNAAPPPPDSLLGVIDDFAYADPAAAQQAWQPMTGSNPAQVAERENRKVLHLDCNFAGTHLERASWDRKVTLDLSGCRGVEFQILCRDASPVSYFSLFFQSAGGWYHGSFFPDSPTGWNTIRIDKADMSPEGSPQGWGQIQTIRISAWRGKAVNTEFYLRNLKQTGLLGADASVAIVRGDSAAQVMPRASGQVRRSATTAWQALERAGIGGVLMSDAELSAEQLERASLVVLPNNPTLPEATQAALVQYVQQGGKLLALPEVSPPLRSALAGATNCLWMDQLLLPRELEGQSRMLLGLAGSLAPGLWREAAATQLKRIGVLSDFSTYEEATQAIARLGEHTPAVGAKLTSARTLRDSALALAAGENFAAAVDKAGSAAQQFEEAYGLAQRPEPGEFRAFWCHSAFGVDGLEWDEAIRRLAENGFTAVLPNMLWGGAAYYKSDFLPEAREAAGRGDQIAQCLAACRKYGVQIHVWKVNWNLGGERAPKAFLERLRKEGRLQTTAQGKEEPWLCPSHPLNRQLEIESLVEIARRYPVDGLHFDYIRYPDSDHCFCAGCRERFQSQTGQRLGAWPGNTLREGPVRQAWLQWRRNQITSVVKGVSERARAIRPTLRISAAVFPNWDNERDSIGQDWKLWCEKGYLDFVCPMDYTPSKASLENMITKQLQWAGGTPCYPGIGVSATSPRLRIDQTIDQILVTRRQKTGGFVIFNYGVPESNELLPMLGLGITKRQ